MQAQFLAQPQGETRLGDFLGSHLGDRKWSVFRAAIEFVKNAGVKHIVAALAAFARRADVKLAVGINYGGTSLEGLSALHEAVANSGEIWVYHDANGSTFHPKEYLFYNDAEAHVAIGSGSLTEGGLYANYEACVVLELDLENEGEKATFDRIAATLDAWRDPSAGLAKRLDDDLLDALAARGYLPPEVHSRETEEAGAASADERPARGKPHCSQWSA